MCTSAAKTESPYQLDLKAHPSESKRARTVLAKTLGDWNLEHLFDDAELVTAELVANAIGRGDSFHLTLREDDGTVIVEVTDSSSKAPRVIAHPENDQAEKGRGMFIVECVSAEWGVRFEGSGKTVWARIGYRSSA